MISDRWGYFDNGYHFWPSLIRAGEHYGLDPDDAVYKERSRDGQLCSTCWTHRTGERYFPCDVQRAQVRDMEAAGYPATTCRTCHRAMPKRDQVVAKCWSCENVEPERRRVRDGAVRVDDGLGCTERLPSWMVNWDGDRTAGGGALT